MIVSYADIKMNQNVFSESYLSHLLCASLSYCTNTVMISFVYVDGQMKFKVLLAVTCLHFLVHTPKTVCSLWPLSREPLFLLCFVCDNLLANLAGDPHKRVNKYTVHTNVFILHMSFVFGYARVWPSDSEIFLLCFSFQNKQQSVINMPNKSGNSLYSF